MELAEDRIHETNDKIPINFSHESPFPMANSWEDMGLKDDILRGIYAYGFETPSEIQKKAILPMIHGRDLIGQSQSGTGKTGTFTIGTLQLIDVNERKTQALILLPTHELVNQVYGVISSLGTFMEGLHVRTLVGGTSINDDIADLNENVPHIIIGCTGRVYDMMRRRSFTPSHLKLLVMDEADEMLSPGFKEQIYNIFQLLPSDTQAALFSATIPDQIMRLTYRFMRNPVHITMTPEKLSLEGIKQYYAAVNSDNEKVGIIKSIFGEIAMTQTIIYANSVPRVVELYDYLLGEGFSVCCIHSNMPKEERKNIIRGFRQGNQRILISSNLTARGIDVQQVSVVINFDIPRNVDTYLHRIGRSGRWGRKGVAINLITKQDIYTMKNIERHYKINIDEMPSKLNL